MSVPEVERLVKDYKGQDLVVISVSLDSSERPVRKFMETHEMTGLVALAADSGVESEYGVQGIPATLVIDKQGNVAKGWEGFGPTMPNAWRKEIDRLLKL
jgi:peroxiredoxin